LQAFYYLQTLLTGDNETGQNPRQFLPADRYPQAKERNQSDQ